MQIHKNFLFLCIGFLVVWLLLSASLSWQVILVGVAVSVVLILVHASTQYALLGAITFNFNTIKALISYFFVFLRELIKSNLDVAFRVINPTLPIKPGIVEVKTRLTVTNEVAVMKSKTKSTTISTIVSALAGTLIIAAFCAVVVFGLAGVTRLQADDTQRLTEKEKAQLRIRLLEHQIDALRYENYLLWEVITRNGSTRQSPARTAFISDRILRCKGALTGKSM